MELSLVLYINIKEVLLSKISLASLLLELTTPGSSVGVVDQDPADTSN